MNHLPKTDSISELASFWQTHDLTDFEEELEEVAGPVFRPAEQVAVRLSSTDASALLSRARREHLSAADLVSQWVHERLRAG